MAQALSSDLVVRTTNLEAIEDLRTALSSSFKHVGYLLHTCLASLLVSLHMINTFSDCRRKSDHRFALISYRNQDRSE